MQRLLKRWIPSEEIFYANLFDWDKVIEVGQAELGCYNDGTNVDDPKFHLVRKASDKDGRVYLITEDKYKRWIKSEDVFNFSWTVEG